jgi:putative transposase
MERKETFVPGEHYHVFSRGTEKRKIFQSKSDYDRFLALLYILNQEKSFQLSQFLKRGERTPMDVFEKSRSKKLVTILSYSLMPNHFHLLIREDAEGGISKFMGRLLTAYSMYFNTKYDRSGSLFMHPFRSVWVADDIQFRHLFSYIHLNCLDLHQKNWKAEGSSDLREAEKFLHSYQYSSYLDLLLPHASRIEAKIIELNEIPELVRGKPLRIEEYEDWRTDPLS